MNKLALPEDKQGWRALCQGQFGGDSYSQKNLGQLIPNWINAYRGEREKASKQEFWETEGDTHESSMEFARSFSKDSLTI